MLKPKHLVLKTISKILSMKNLEFLHFVLPFTPQSHLWAHFVMSHFLFVFIYKYHIIVLYMWN